MVGMGTKSRETIYGASARHSAEVAAEARKVADRLACEASRPHNGLCDVHPLGVCG
jgi:hypothetical protein